MKKIILTTALSFALVASVMAQDKIWSLDDCMRYAVENSPKVKQQLYTNNTYKADHLPEAIIKSCALSLIHI